MISIRSPKAGDTFPAGTDIVLTGTGGPVANWTTQSVTAVSGDPGLEFVRGGHANMKFAAQIGAFEHDVGAFTTPGTYQITVTGADGSSDSVTITITE
jgi:hypothetical protein